MWSWWKVSVTTAHDSGADQGDSQGLAKFLISIGACATAGGIQSLRNWKDVDQFIQMVYATPSYIKTLAQSTPISAHVPVDFELNGCPINKKQALEVVTSLLLGRAQTLLPTRSALSVSAAALCVSRVRPGSSLPGTADPCGLRSDLSRLQSRLLWLLRPQGDAQDTASLAAWFSQGYGDERAQPVWGSSGPFTPTPPPFARRAKPMTTKNIIVKYLARVEGEGGLNIQIKDDTVTRVQLKIFEPPRFFEAFLRGRNFTEAPDITSRICGICPVAYQMTAVHAMEAALGVTIPGPIRALRRLLYCGEWIESHGLHVFMLHAPDFLGYQDAIRMAQDHPDTVKMGLRLKKVGNDLVTVLGGREIHPINVRVGGFYKAPNPRDLAPLAESLKWAPGGGGQNGALGGRVHLPGV